MLEYFQIVPDRPLTEGERKRLAEVMNQTVGHCEAWIQTPFIDGERTNDTAEFGSVASLKEARSLVAAFSGAIRGLAFSIVIRKDEGADLFRER